MLTGELQRLFYILAYPDKLFPYISSHYAILIEPAAGNAFIFTKQRSHFSKK